MTAAEGSEPRLVTTSATARAEEGMRSSVRMRDFGPVVMDEPESLGGTDRGPNPMEYVMGALGGCVSVMIRLIAGEMGLRYAGADIHADGVLDLRGLLGTPGVRRHFQTVNLTVTLETDEPPERVAELRDKVHDRCPAINLLKDAGVDLQADWRVVPTRGA